MVGNKLEERNNNLLPIQALWIGDELSDMEKLSILSFIKQGHLIHLYSYKEFNNLPEGCINLDAAEILPENAIFKYINRDTYSGFANLFRYKLLFERGGIWVDLDFICLKPFDFNNERLFASQGNNMANPCMIKTYPNCEIVKYCFDYSSGLDVSNIRFGQTGTQLLNNAIKYHNLGSLLAKPDDFCPINYPGFMRLTRPRSAKYIEEETINSYAIHLWNGMWKQAGIDKNFSHPASSYYGKLQNDWLQIK